MHKPNIISSIDLSSRLISILRLTISENEKRVYYLVRSIIYNQVEINKTVAIQAGISLNYYKGSINKDVSENDYCYCYCYCYFFSPPHRDNWP